MRVCVCSGLSLYEFVMRGMQTVSGIDLLIFSFGTLPVLSYENELGGEDSIFAEMCTISDNMECVLIAAADTNLYGINHKSAAVIDKGRLINISDMVNVGEDSIYTAGGEYNVYRTSAGKIGLLIDKDIYYGEPELLYNTGCDYIVASADSELNGAAETAIKNCALNKCSVIGSFRDKYMLADTDGMPVDYKEGFGVFEFVPKRVK